MWAPSATKGTFCPIRDKTAHPVSGRPGSNYVAGSEALTQQRPSIEAEQAGGGALVAAAHLDHALDVARGDGVEVERFRTGGGRRRADQRARQLAIDVGVGQRDRALDQVLQLADVARVVVTQ